MIVEVVQRDYVKGFLDFVKSFLITDGVTIEELELVEANLTILKERIEKAKEKMILPFL